MKVNLHQLSFPISLILTSLHPIPSIFLQSLLFDTLSYGYLPSHQLVFGLCYFLTDAFLQMLEAVNHGDPQWTFLTGSLQIYKLEFDFSAKKKENETQQEAHLSKSRTSDKL